MLSPWITRVGIALALILLLTAIVAGSLASAGSASSVKNPALPGGSTTHRRAFDGNAFSHGSANLSFEAQLKFKIGNGLFRRVWVTAPASTRSGDGLGPIFNARSCQRCHLKDGRGHPPAANWPEDDAISMLVRLSVPPRTQEQRQRLESGVAASIAEPVYGGQLQDHSVQGVLSEGRIHIEREVVEIVYPDGSRAELEKPTYRLTDLAYGPTDPELMMSPRVAPQMIGLGLLEAISEEDILAKEDPDDADGDGISGRANRVWDVRLGRRALGRFGWKAEQPTLEQQSASAFLGDIGMSTPLFSSAWGDCTTAQNDCRRGVHGAVAGEVEISREMFDLVVFYARNLAVPTRRRINDPQVARGETLFGDIGCGSCHTPSHKTAVRADMPEQSGQVIWPYTDLLLHDMGPDLSDGRPSARADGSEWRTPPLWGIGLTKTVNGHTRFLHDGRARNIEEAILWHGGEGEKSRDAFMNLSSEERASVIAFVNSL